MTDGLDIIKHLNIKVADIDPSDPLLGHLAANQPTQSAAATPGQQAALPAVAPAQPAVAPAQPAGMPGMVTVPVPGVVAEPAPTVPFVTSPTPPPKLKKVYEVVYHTSVGDVLSFYHYYDIQPGGVGKKILILGVDRSAQLVQQFAPKPGTIVTLDLTTMGKSSNVVTERLAVKPLGVQFPFEGYTLNVMLIESGAYNDGKARNNQPENAVPQ